MNTTSPNPSAVQKSRQQANRTIASRVVPIALFVAILLMLKCLWQGCRLVAEATSYPLASYGILAVALLPVVLFLIRHRSNVQREIIGHELAEDALDDLMHV